VVGFLLISLCTSFSEIFWVILFVGVAVGVSIPALSALVVEEGKRIAGMGRLMFHFVMNHNLRIIVGPVVEGNLILCDPNRITRIVCPSRSVR